MGELKHYFHFEHGEIGDLGKYYLKRELFILATYVIMGVFLYFAPMTFEKVKQLFFIFPEFFLHELTILNEKGNGLGSKVAIVCIFFMISNFLAIIIDSIMILKFITIFSPENKKDNFRNLVSMSIFILIIMLVIIPNLGDTTIRRSSPIGAISVAAWLTSVVVRFWTFFLITKFFVRHANDGA